MINDYPTYPAKDRVKVSWTEFKEVALSDEQSKEIAISYFCKKFNLHPEYYIEDGNVVHTYEECGSHRYDVTDVIRVASDKDKLYYSLLRTLK